MFILVKVMDPRSLALIPLLRDKVWFTMNRLIVSTAQQWQGGSRVEETPPPPPPASRYFVGRYTLCERVQFAYKPGSSRRGASGRDKFT